MNTSQLLLSLFPGIGLLDMAFEEQGFCIVRGPDLLWGGDIHRFHPPAGRFGGLIGGPPCPAHSIMRAAIRAQGRQTAADLIPEFERCVAESRPGWFLMENVKAAPPPRVNGYAVHSFVLNNRQVGGVQERKRRFSFGVPGKTPVDLTMLIETVSEPAEWFCTVRASGGARPGTEQQRGKRPLRDFGYVSEKTIRMGLRLQGLPEDFFARAPFTVAGKMRVIGNGVPLPLGRAIARAVCAALQCRQELIA